MGKKLFFLLLIASSTFSHACLNEYHTLKNGVIVYDTDATSVGPEYWKTELDTTELKKQASEFLKAYHRSDSIEYYSDYGITLTYLGELEKAKKIYLEIEASKPNLYSTAANLGTVYELLGQNDSALFWIKRGIEINPQSHEGSEWIHVKILEHKILFGDSARVSVLQLDFGDDKMPKNVNDYDLRAYLSEIIYQLRERTLFVKPPNEIVGSLYADLADIMFIENSEKSSHIWVRGYYKAAESYGFSSPNFEKHKQYLNELIGERARDKDSFNPKILMLVVGFLVLSIIGFYFWRRKQKLRT